MPGLRLGYLVSRDTSLIARLEEVSQPWSISLPAIEAGLAALKEQEYLRRSRAYLQTEKEKLLACLEKMAEQKKPEVIDKVYGSAANYIFFHGAAGLAEKLLEHGILIRDCSNYTGLEAGYYRIAVRTAEENKRLIQALQELEEQRS
jgi:threonine-phosphate decarboxylase